MVREIRIFEKNEKFVLWVRLSLHLPWLNADTNVACPKVMHPHSHDHTRGYFDTRSVQPWIERYYMEYYCLIQEYVDNVCDCTYLTGRMISRLIRIHVVESA